MPLMNWSDKLSVGVKALDEDHKKLVGMVNQLHEGLVAGHGREVLAKILDGLVSYTKVHFAREEKYFLESGYPGAALHKKEHDHLTQQVLDVQKKYKEGTSSTLSLDVMHFLKDWLVNHIQKDDQKYMHHLNTHGIK